MTLQQELASWNPFSAPSKVDEVPDLGSKAPSIARIQFPTKDQKPVILTFLRHCGCPFAEKAFMSMRKAATENPSFHFIAVSHSDDSSTRNWLDSVGGAGDVEVLVDDQRDIYGAYGLGASSFWAVLNPWSMRNVFTLGKLENIWNRPTESGSRWQTSGLFAIDEKGTVEYTHKAQSADDMGDLDAAVMALKRR